MTLPVGPLRCFARITSARPLVGALVVVVLVAVDEGDEVGVLLDATRLAQVGEDRPLVLALLDRARELRHGDDRQVELAGEDLELARDLRHLLHAVLVLRAGAHQLQVVDDDQPQVRLLATSAGAAFARSPMIVIEPVSSM